VARSDPATLLQCNLEADTCYHSKFERNGISLYRLAAAVIVRQFDNSRMSTIL
jgi:hypothetical protein